MRPSYKPKALHASGVYIFLHGTNPIYIGKAADLKKRLASYFRAHVSEKVRQMREEATALEWQETESEIEALIREAELIKKHLPKYNVLLRDDKSYFYVAVTRDQFPKIFVVHKTSLDRNKYRRVIGPFTSGSALRAVLKILRRAFPYCTCTVPHRRPCVNAQIGRCHGFCCSKNNLKITNDKLQKEYKANIKNVIAVLSGKRRQIASRLKRDMREAAKKHDFEQAAKLRDQLKSMENIFAHRTLLEVRLPIGSRTSSARRWASIEREIQTLLGINQRIRRVEGYDISNISGASATGSLVVFMDGVPAKSEYRKFKIKTVRGANDVAMHTEVMRRRIAHPEWPYPELIVMDGGKPQMNAAQSEIGNRKSEIGAKHFIHITALAKKEEELYIESRQRPVRLDSLPHDVMHFFQRVRNESHRFAKKYHHKLREMSYR